jgi:polysaccharide pyruvyl transferase WcaK-like protein
MKAYLWGWAGNLNTGDDALLCVAAWGLRKFGGMETMFMDADVSGVACKLADVRTAQPQRLRVQGATRLRRWAFRGMTDCFVLTGGSLFPSQSNVDRLLADKGWHRDGKRIIALGISVGPFESTGHEARTAELLNRMDYVGLRDDFSYEWCRAYGVKSPCFRAFDLAVLMPRLLPPQPLAERKKKLGVCFLATGLQQNAHGLDNDLNTVRRLGEETSRVARRHGLEVAVFSFCRHARFDDTQVSEVFAQACRDVPVEQYYHDGDPFRTYQQILSCSHVVSMRLHGAILAYAGQIPFLMLSYHPKCSEFAKTIGLDERLLAHCNTLKAKDYAERLEFLLSVSSVPARVPLAEAQERALLNFQPRLLDSSAECANPPGPHQNGQSSLPSRRPRTDQPHGFDSARQVNSDYFGLANMKLDKLKTRFANWRFRHDTTIGKSLWSETPFLKAPEVHQRISRAIDSRTPFMAGRLGVVEASCLMWAYEMPHKYPWIRQWTTKYWETAVCATNAGIRPRTPESYRRFSAAMSEALGVADLMGFFRLQTQYSVAQRFCRQAIPVEMESISITMTEGRPWSASLAGRTVFAVSPFLETFQRQKERLRKIWPNPETMPDFELIGYRFPYLIDDDCELSWWRVMDEVKEALSRSSYDVALFGCGGVGLHLAAFAKNAGKVGLHLGGFLQLLFGVYGNRYLNQEWHKRHINEAWVRPPPEEVAKSAQRVEGACYW